MASSPVIVFPGAWTRASAFDDVCDALRSGGHEADVVELPSRSSRLVQLDRGGLSAIDAGLDNGSKPARGHQS